MRQDGVSAELRAERPAKRRRDDGRDHASLPVRPDPFRRAAPAAPAGRTMREEWAGVVGKASGELGRDHRPGGKRTLNLRLRMLSMNRCAGPARCALEPRNSSPFPSLPSVEIPSSASPAAALPIRAIGVIRGCLLPRVRRDGEEEATGWKPVPRPEVTPPLSAVATRCPSYPRQDA